MERFRVEIITACVLLILIVTITVLKVSTGSMENDIIVKYKELESRNMELELENENLRGALNYFRHTCDKFNIQDLSSIPKYTTGMKNNNPLNIVAMGSKKPWYGQIGKDSRNHAIFDSYEHGIRAAYVTLRGFYQKHNLDTPIAITSRFCESNQEKYAKFIGKRLGIRHDEQFNVLERMPELLKAMIHFENGFQPFPDSMFVAYYSR